MDAKEEKETKKKNSRLYLGVGIAREHEGKREEPVLLDDDPCNFGSSSKTSESEPYCSRARKQNPGVFSRAKSEREKEKK